MAFIVLVHQVQSFASEGSHHQRDVDVEIPSFSFPWLLPLGIELRPAARTFPSLTNFLVVPYIPILVVLNLDKQPVAAGTSVIPT